MATSKARPALASQAEKASKIMGAAVKFVVLRYRVHKERARNRDSIMPSRHRRADKRWARLKASPVSPSVKADTREN